MATKNNNNYQKYSKIKTKEKTIKKENDPKNNQATILLITNKIKILRKWNQI